MKTMPRRGVPRTDVPTMLFPMWVLPISIFLEMAGPAPSHQELAAQGKLVMWEPGMYCLFCSHEWLSAEEADPSGAQLAVLQETLKNIITGAITVYTSMNHLFMFHTMKTLTGLTGKKVRELAEGYIWLDWVSIPQITARTASASTCAAVLASVQAAVDSIPAYAEAADLFVVLGPSMWSGYRGGTCDFSSWRSRGWCRVELVAAALSRSEKPLVVIHSTTNVFIMPANCIVKGMPGEGNFAVPSDRVTLLSIMQNILNIHLQSLWDQPDDKNLNRARFFLAMQGQFLLNLGSTEEQAKRSVEDLSQADVTQFQQQLRFPSVDSMTKPTRSGVGALFYAAVAGNTGVLRALVRARGDVNERISSRAEQPMINLVKGHTPLIGAAYFNGDPSVVECLLELHANHGLSDRGGYGPLHYAAGAGKLEAMKLLLDSRVQVDVKAAQGERPLHVAALTGETKAALLLLQRRAAVNSSFGAGTTPLMFAAGPGEVEVCRILLEHKADVNQVAKPVGCSGVAFATMLRLGSWWFPDGSPLGQVAMTEGATALHIAAMNGHVEVVRLLLEGGAQATQRHRTGPTAQQLAEKGKHREVVTLLSEAAEPPGALFLEV